MLKRKAIFLSIAFSTLALVIVIGVYVGSFYLFYYDALHKNAFYGLYYIEKGNYRNCSVITEFLYEERDVWPFTGLQFDSIYHPLIWMHMKSRRQTSDGAGKPLDISNTRAFCISRGVDPALFDGDLAVALHRNGPVLIKIDYFGTRIIADFTQFTQ